MSATLDDLMTELKAIRALLEARPAPAAAASHPPHSGGKFDDEPIPQPNPAWPLARADAHTIHFGKNEGVRLADLKDTSLAFYAKEKPPQLKRDGKTPFEKRPADLDLENAARTVWHHRRGTLARPAPAGVASARQAAPTPAKPASAPQPEDDDVPF